MYHTINTDQYTMHISNNKKTETSFSPHITIKSIEESSDTLRTNEIYHTAKFLENIEPCQQSEDTESLNDMTMIINYDTLTSGDTKMHITDQVSVDEVREDLGCLIRKEVARFDKDNIECQMKIFTEEELEKRLEMIDQEMQRELDELKGKFVKNKDKILNAIKLKKKNQHHQMY